MKVILPVVTADFAFHQNTDCSVCLCCVCNAQVKVILPVVGLRIFPVPWGYGLWS